MTALAVDQQVHPGIRALQERIRIAKDALQTMETRDGPWAKKEAQLLEELALLSERVAEVRRQREQLTPNIALRRNELKELERLMAKCQENENVATAVWIRLLEMRPKPSTRKRTK